MIVFGIAWKYTAISLWPKLNILSMTCYFVFASLVHQNSNPGHGVIKVIRAHFWSQTYFDKLTFGFSLTFTSLLLVLVSNIVKVRLRPKVTSSNWPDFSFDSQQSCGPFHSLWYVQTMAFTASWIARDALFGFKLNKDQI